MTEPVHVERNDLIQRLLNRYADSSRRTAAHLRMQLSGASHVVLTRWLFLRLLGAVFLVAFLSFWRQAGGLVGEQGILPVARTLDMVRSNLPGVSPLGRVAQFPTLCWVGGGVMVPVCCAAGVVCSLAAMVGVAAPLCFFLMWAAYLSLCTAGLQFTALPGDALLLEAGFLAVFYAPWQLRPRIGKEPLPSFAVLLLFRWLVFRMVMGAALVKLADADGAWFPRLTALTDYLQTQPLPAWAAWHAYHLPAPVLRVAAAALLLAELILPLFILLGRRLRLAACIGLVLLHLGGGLFEGLGFLPLLGSVLCLVLLDDIWLDEDWRARFVDDERPGPPSLRLRVNQVVGLVVFVGLFSISATVFTGQFRDVGLRFGKAPDLEGANWMQRIAEAAAPFRIVSAHGRPGPVYTRRPEIVIEGSRDGETWTPYMFRCKPGPTDRRPRGSLLHPPRLDYPMGAAARGNLDDPQIRSWFAPLLTRLLAGTEPVVRLLDNDPFAGEPPRYVRALLYDYAFTAPSERARTDNWWKRRYRAVYCPPLSKRSQ